MKTSNSSTSIYAYFVKGLMYGLVATLVMTLVMSTCRAMGVSPSPEPFPFVITKLLFGELLRGSSMIITSILLLSCGAINGGLVCVIFKTRSGFWHGLIWGIFLWLITQLFIFPIIGWGLFGAAISIKIAIETLVYYLVYGAILGWGLNRMKK